jgi:polar amino acid transport system substrate-binding protein
MVRLAFALLGLVAFLDIDTDAKADTLADIKAKNELVVGTKADYPPYGFRDKSGGIVGIEPDLGADIAKRLGVKVRIEPVQSSNRIQFLQQGKIDLMIATMNVTDERKKAVGIVEPAYYASGIAAFVNPKAGIKSAADLKGKPVCAIQGNFFNAELQSKFVQTDLVAFKGVPEAEQALTAGQCVAFVFDDTLILSKKKFEADRWKDFDVVLITEVTPLPWGIAVKLEDRDQPFGKFVSEAITDWHKTGALIEIEKKWLGTNTKWLLDEQRKSK